MQTASNRQFGCEITRFFDKIYCVNLDSRPDRWLYIQNQFAKFGLKKKIERISAIDVRNDPELKKHEKLLKNNFSLLAMCGCMLSHRKIIEQAKRADLNNVLVFEDDIKILEDSIGDIHMSLGQLAELDWDIFYLGATYLFTLKAVGSHLISTPEGAYATHAIAYNSSIYDQILDQLPSNPVEFLQSNQFEINAVDKWLQSDLFDHRKFYGTNPIMVVQGLQESDIAFKQQDGIEKTQIELFSKNLKY